MDNFELLNVTEGKNRRESLVFHVIETVKKRHFELLIEHVCQNTLTLRFEIYLFPLNYTLKYY